MKTVLFVCVENACRSQMAEGLVNQYGRGQVVAYSAGSRPSGKINLNAIEVMREIGVDISSGESKGFADLPTKEFDYVVTLGCEDRCPYIPETHHIDWHIEDPRDRDMEFFRKVRDDIWSKVEILINEISETSDYPKKRT
jgi:arsenate reductase